MRVQDLIAAEVIHPDLKTLADDPSSSLEHDLHLDGINLTHLAMQIEDAMGVHLSDKTVQGWLTVEDVLRSVRK